MNIVPMGAAQTKEKWRDHYITPDYILKAVRGALGRDWFDPCPSNPDFDGLKEINHLDPKFINPPFSEYQKWVDHWLPQHGDQIWLSHTNNSSQWYKDLMHQCSAICLLYERIKFIDPRTMEPTKNSAYGKSQSVIYKGDLPNHFAESFKYIGKVFQPVAIWTPRR